MDEREKNLPKWAKELIEGLRFRLKVMTEQFEKELSRLGPENKRLVTEKAAILDLLERAAVGGSLTAKAVVDVLAGYELQLVKPQ